MTSDTRDLDDVKQDLKYDHRNLLTEMRVVKKTGGGDGYETYQLMYNYDEAGNRVRKREYFYQGEDPMPVFEEDDMTGSWDLVGDEYYVRDVSGKEIAVYHSYDLDHWNVWGTDNVGKINANGDKFFYIKDHLGSVRVVLNSSNQIVAANDYDCWGYPLENRSYQSDDIDYKFTGKQRDAETSYDYFGARYYDERIANWTSMDPLFGARISWTPYNYVLRNPLSLIDVHGLFDDYYVFNEDGVYQNEIIRSKEKGIAIRNHETKGYTYYLFNEPDKDDQTMQKLIKEYGNTGVKLVFIKTQSDISKYMTDAGVYSHNSDGNRLLWAIEASRENNPMDFWGSKLGYEMQYEGIDAERYSSSPKFPVKSKNGYAA